MHSVALGFLAKIFCFLFVQKAPEAQPHTNSRGKDSLITQTEHDLIISCIQNDLSE